MYTSVHLNVAQESYFVKLFEILLDVSLEWRKTRDTLLMYPCGIL